MGSILFRKTFKPVVTGRPRGVSRGPGMSGTGAASSWKTAVLTGQEQPLSTSSSGASGAIRLPDVDIVGSTSGSASTSSRYEAAVAALQRQLAADGYNPGTIDGIWGPNTSGALQRAVNAMGLPAATTRYGQSMVMRLTGTSPVTGGGTGSPVEEQGGLFANLSNWFNGVFGGGTDLASGTAAAAGQVEQAIQAGASIRGAQTTLSSVISNPLFLLGVTALGVGVAVAVLPKSKRGKRGK